MGGFWKILELEPTRNISAIRRAYAKKTRICHPEEDFCQGEHSESFAQPSQDGGLLAVVQPYQPAGQSVQEADGDAKAGKDPCRMWRRVGEEIFPTRLSGLRYL